MIKQNWDISLSEKKRILELHESATKNLYLIKEQKPRPGYEEMTTTEDVKFPQQNLSNQFPIGDFDSPELKNSIERLIPNIREFIETNPDGNFVLRITAGESQITNPEAFKVKGSLALRRAQTVKDYFQTYLADFIKSGKLIIQSPKNVEEVEIGHTKFFPHSTNEKNKNHQFYLDNLNNYKREQFVLFDIVGAGKKVSSSVICNLNDEAKGGFGRPEDNFVTYDQTFDISKLTDRTKIIISLGTYLFPDMLTVETGGKIYSSGFVGELDGEGWHILLGTILGNTYNGKPSSPFPQNLEILNSPQDKDYLKNFWEGNIEDLRDNLGPVLKNVLKHKRVDKIVDEVTWYKYPPKTIINQVPERRSENPLIAGYTGGQIIIFKDSSMTDLRIRVYSPFGPTQWTIEARCF